MCRRQTHTLLPVPVYLVCKLSIDSVTSVKKNHKLFTTTILVISIWNSFDNLICCTLRAVSQLISLDSIKVKKKSGKTQDCSIDKKIQRFRSGNTHNEDPLLAILSDQADSSVTDQPSTSAQRVAGRNDTRSNEKRQVSYCFPIPKYYFKSVSFCIRFYLFVFAEGNMLRRNNPKLTIQYFCTTTKKS